MEVQALTTKEVISIMLYNAQRLLDTSNFSVYTAFEQTIISFYYFAEARIKNTPHYCTLNEYKEIFFNAVMESQEIPSVYCILITRYYIHGLEERRKTPLNTDFLKTLRQQISEHRTQIEDLNTATADIRKILGHQTFELYMKYALPLIKQHRITGMSADYTLMDIFNYGYIIGKREERAKKSGRLKATA